MSYAPSQEEGITIEKKLLIEILRVYTRRISINGHFWLGSDQLPLKSHGTWYQRDHVAGWQSLLCQLEESPTVAGALIGTSQNRLSLLSLNGFRPFLASLTKCHMFFS
jgi:hypothetical protein